MQNEPFEFNGIPNTRVAVAVTSYGMKDVRSIYGGPLASIGPGSVGNLEFDILGKYIAKIIAKKN